MAPSPAAVMPRSARRSAAGPSTSSESASSGSGGTALTQTIQRSASGGEA